MSEAEQIIRGSRWNLDFIEVGESGARILRGLEAEARDVAQVVESKVSDRDTDGGPLQFTLSISGKTKTCSRCGIEE